jgi:hypothetical protein
MQTNNLDAHELADLLGDPATKIWEMLDLGSTRMYVLTWSKQDILVFADMSNNATVVYDSAAFDAESGGSVHDHARAIAADA